MEWKNRIGSLSFYEDLIDTHMDRPCIEWSSKMKQSYNIPIIDLHECCQDRDQDWTFSFDRGHLNNKGIKSVIPHLQKELIQEGIIDVD